MKLQLNKLMAGLVMAGGTVALVGCGDGGSPELAVSGNVVSSVTKADTAAIAVAQAVLKEVPQVSVTIPTAGLEFPVAGAASIGGVTNPSTTSGTAPANSVLTVKASTQSTVTVGTETMPVVGTFNIANPVAAGAAVTDEVSGDIVPGSCIFIPRIVRGIFASRFVVGGFYRMVVCTITIPTINTVIGVPRTVIPTITLAPTLITPVIVLNPPAPVNIVVNTSPTGTPTVTVGNTQLPPSVTPPVTTGGA